MNESLAFGVKNVAVPYPVKWTGKRVECIETRAAHNRHSALPVPLAEALGHRTDRVVDTEIGGVGKVKGGTSDVSPITRPRVDRPR
jgi:hypothetical protein